MTQRSRGPKTADERVLEAIFNPEEPAGSNVEVSEGTCLKMVMGKRSVNVCAAV